MSDDELNERMLRGDRKAIASRVFTFGLFTSRNSRRSKEADEFEELEAPGYEPKKSSGTLQDDGKTIHYEVPFVFDGECDDPVLGHYIQDEDGETIMVKEYEKPKWVRVKGDRLVVELKR